MGPDPESTTNVVEHDLPLYNVCQPTFYRIPSANSTFNITDTLQSRNNNEQVDTFQKEKPLSDSISENESESSLETTAVQSRKDSLTDQSFLTESNQGESESDCAPLDDTEMEYDTSALSDIPVARRAPYFSAEFEDRSPIHDYIFRATAWCCYGCKNPRELLDILLQTGSAISSLESCIVPLLVSFFLAHNMEGLSDDKLACYRVTQSDACLWIRYILVRTYVRVGAKCIEQNILDEIEYEKCSNDIDNEDVTNVAQWIKHIEKAILAFKVLTTVELSLQ